jgi:hypothetical protein
MPRFGKQSQLARRGRVGRGPEDEGCCTNNKQTQFGGGRSCDIASMPRFGKQSQLARRGRVGRGPEDEGCCTNNKQTQFLPLCRSGGRRSREGNCGKQTQSGGAAWRAGNKHAKQTQFGPVSRRTWGLRGNVRNKPNSRRDRAGRGQRGVGRGTNAQNEPNSPQTGREHHRQGQSPWRCRPAGGNCVKQTRFGGPAWKAGNERAKRSQFARSAGAPEDEMRKTNPILDRRDTPLFQCSIIPPFQSDANRTKRTQFLAAPGGTRRGRMGRGPNVQNEAKLWQPGKPGGQRVREADSAKQSQSRRRFFVLSGGRSCLSRGGCQCIPAAPLRNFGAISCRKLRGSPPADA